MKKFAVIASALILVLTMSIIVAHAREVSLTDETVEKFISSMKEVQVIGQQYDNLNDLYDESEFNAEDQMIIPENPVSDSLDKVREHKIYDRIQDMAQDYGFSDAEEWARVGDRVFRAYISLDMKEHGPAMRSEMEEAIREIQEHPQMSREQKRQMTQMIENAMSSLEKMADAPEEDIEVVSAHMDELRNLLEIDM